MSDEARGSGLDKDFWGTWTLEHGIELIDEGSLGFSERLSSEDGGNVEYFLENIVVRIAKTFYLSR